MRFFRILFRMFLDLLAYMPTELGVQLRYFVYRSLFKKTNGFFRVEFGVTILGFENIELGRNVSFLKNSYVYAKYQNEGGRLIIGDNFFLGTNSQLCANRGNITIGNDVMIASNCVLRPDNHDISDVSKSIAGGGTI